MLLWEAEHLRQADAAIAAARAGQPTVLLVEGEAGMGKTTLLRAVGQRAAGFAVRTAEGVENDRSPLGMLAQWGVEPAEHAGSGVTAPFLAAQGLRDLVDVGDRAGPLLLQVDDLQWADPESVEALTWLLRRASGDPLLVLAGSRTLPAGAHPAWQRWVSDADHAVRIALTGLTLPQVTTLVRAHWPESSEALARRLSSHTAGNPLYLHALLDEFGAPSLDRMRVMPAPTVYTRHIGDRLARLSPAQVRLLRAVAVLGPAWVPLLDAAEVAQTNDPHDVAQSLIDAGLLQVSDLGRGAVVRVSHALTRAAIYQQTPLAERRALHAAAAAVVLEEAGRLEHRLAAATRFDEQLAQDLEAFGRAHHDRRSFRQAAQYLLSASGVTRASAERERRWLEALFSAVLAGDLAAVRSEFDALRSAGDPARSALVEGAVALVEGREVEAARILGGPPSGVLEAADPVTRYRFEVMLAWARVAIGYDTSLVAEGMRRADALGVVDPAMAGYAVFPRGQAEGRLHGPAAALEARCRLPEVPAATPIADTYDLAWRGVVRFDLGLFDDAHADLREANERFRDGLTDITDGIMHAFLGAAHWYRGRWDLANVSMRLAVDIAGDRLSPIVPTFTALAPSGVGNFAEADKLLDQAVTALREMPWPEALQSLMNAQVIRLHAGDSTADRADWLPWMRSQWAGAPFDQGVLGAPWFMHATQAAVWAGEFGYAEQLIERMRQTRPQPLWTNTAARWLEGLVAEATGRLEPALALLQGAVDLGWDDLPLYRAHTLLDHARLLRRLDQPVLARRSAALAERQYRSLGALPYVRRAETLADPRVAARGTSGHGLSLQLTERERDVLTLVVAGLSYAQIARDLFITQSTVSYHLSNVYAKADVPSRHALTALVRRDPAPFGLSAAAG